MVAPTVENGKTVQRGPVSCSTMLGGLCSETVRSRGKPVLPATSKLVTAADISEKEVGSAIVGRVNLGRRRGDEQKTSFSIVGHGSDEIEEASLPSDCRDPELEEDAFVDVVGTAPQCRWSKFESEQPPLVFPVDRLRSGGVARDDHGARSFDSEKERSCFVVPPKQFVVVGGGFRIAP